MFVRSIFIIIVFATPLIKPMAAGTGRKEAPCKIILHPTSPRLKCQHEMMVYGEHLNKEGTLSVHVTPTKRDMEFFGATYYKNKITIYYQTKNPDGTTKEQAAYFKSELFEKKAFDPLFTPSNPQSQENLMQEPRPNSRPKSATASNVTGSTESALRSHGYGNDDDEKTLVHTTSSMPIDTEHKKEPTSTTASLSAIAKAFDSETPGTQSVTPESPIPLRDVSSSIVDATSSITRSSILPQQGSPTHGSQRTPDTSDDDDFQTTFFAPAFADTESTIQPSPATFSLELHERTTTHTLATIDEFRFPTRDVVAAAMIPDQDTDQQNPLQLPTVGYVATEAADQGEDTGCCAQISKKISEIIQSMRSKS